jgi:hypothetical protein
MLGGYHMGMYYENQEDFKRALKVTMDIKERKLAVLLKILCF